MRNPQSTIRNSGRVRLPASGHSEIRNPQVVAVEGGTGTYTALTGLKRYSADLTAVVSMADSGGSSGILRDEFGHLPPGDVAAVCWPSPLSQPQGCCGGSSSTASTEAGG
jgi:hypothetical protein